MRRSYILLGLCALVVITAGIMFSVSPDMGERYATMQREVELSAGVKDIAMAVIALAIAGYIGWHFMKRD